jgi:hypothetical protein
MNLLNPVIIQLIIDLALLLMVVFLLWRFNASVRNPIIKSHQEMMTELKAMMVESQASSENFLQALEKSRLALKEIALELDLKEKRVKQLLAKSDNGSMEIKSKQPAGLPEDRYNQVVRLIKEGYTEAQTSEATGFTEPEVGLIVDLYRVKNENA